MRRRWTLIAGLTDNWWATGNFNPFELWGQKKSLLMICHYMAKKALWGSP